VKYSILTIKFKPSGGCSEGENPLHILTVIFTRECRQLHSKEPKAA